MKQLLLPVQPSHITKTILQQIAQGNQTAFAQLFSYYYDTVYSNALMYIKVHELAEDATQQVFLKIWEKRQTLPIIENIQAWLFITARNEIMNMFRKQMAGEQYKNHLREIFAEEEGSPEETLILKQKTALLHNIIQQLPERQREAFLLSREKGLGYEAIAAQMKISLATVKEHISKALHTIKNLLLAHKDEFSLLLLIQLQLLQ